MDVTPSELRSTEIKEAWRGYHRDEVDDLLERAATTIEALTRQVQEAPAARSVESAAPLATTETAREHEEMLQRTLIMAQRAADEAVKEAQTRARQMIEESEAKAQALVGDAESSAQRIAEVERRRYEAEIHELEVRRDALQRDADALESYASAYRERLRAAIEADLAALGSASIEPPSERPALTELPSPAPSPTDEPVAPDEGVHEAFTPSFENREQPAPSSAPWESGEHASWNPTRASEQAVAAERPAPASAVGVWPPPAPEAQAASDPTQGTWSGEPASWEAATALPSWQEPTGQYEMLSAEVPMEAHALDADSLDDDAFFASLRDAVRDDAALGGRDADAYLSDDPSDDRRRFRRRR